MADWTPEQDAEILRLWNEEGMSAAAIAIAVPWQMTRNAVIGRIHRLRHKHNCNIAKRGNGVPGRRVMFRNGKPTVRGRAEEIIALAKQGFSSSAIATMFDVGETTVRCAVPKGTFRHVRQLSLLTPPVYHGPPRPDIEDLHLLSRREPQKQRLVQPTIPEPRPLIATACRLEDAGTIGAAVMALDGLHCKWPIGDVGKPGFRFCMAPKLADGTPYCAHHNAIAAGRETTREAAAE